GFPWSPDHGSIEAVPRDDQVVPPSPAFPWSPDHGSIEAPGARGLRSDSPGFRGPPTTAPLKRIRGIIPRLNGAGVSVVPRPRLHSSSFARIRANAEPVVSVVPRPRLH